ncbi:MAG: lecithin retinol acyltransferase family protein [Clostridia bacterium]|nr:lecithin retinol acyltransferase family protein [Clostridia bacterium]
MKWSLREFKPADMVRVKSGSFYHYAICVSDSTVVQFGDSIVDPRVDPNTVQVHEAKIEDFLKGRFAEVADFDKKELKKKFSNEQIISNAKGRIGEKGYHFLHNNCEHFANECVFGEHSSSQLDALRKDIQMGLAHIDVYVSDIQRFKHYNKLPKFAKEEIKRLKNPASIEQKKCAYGLLNYALQKSFDIKPKISLVTKDKRGKPTLKGCFFSISHTSNLVAVAVSRRDVGVDIEEIKEHAALSPERNHVLSESETAESFVDVLSLWTKKEAIFKLDNSLTGFIPGKIDTNLYPTKTIKVLFEGKEYFLSVAMESLAAVNVIYLDGEQG